MSTRVVTTSNLFDYFHERVEPARTSRKLSDETGLYLASLLTERARTDRPAPPETTLAELHMKASQAPPAQQARTYRELGDRALYLLGYFAESLKRRTVGPSYYADMGAAAYYRTDQIFKRWFADAFGPVFAELSVEFDAAVAVLGEVREAHRSEQPDDPLWLYERWLETGDEALAAQLRKKGLLLFPPGSHDS